MKFFRSYKKYNYRYGLIRKKYRNKIWVVLCAIILVTIPSVFLLTRQLYDSATSSHKSSQVSKLKDIHLPDLPFLSQTKKSNSQSENKTISFSHNGVISTIFWVGEGADFSNGYISNTASAWDELWLQHFGGVDDPKKRNSYSPASFTPKENPFYIALPYSDIAKDGTRKSSASSCLVYGVQKSKNYSWCKNTWVAVRHGQKIAYAQWEDVGPFEEDDFNYIFGNALPKNKMGANAGIDVSPAIADYLGLGDVDKVEWTFISSADVTDGPWKNIITSSLGSTLE